MRGALLLPDGKRSRVSNTSVSTSTMSTNFVPNFPFTPQGFTDLQHRFNESRDAELQQDLSHKFVAADIAFLASGSRATSHLLPGTRLDFHPLLVAARAAHPNARHDFNYQTKCLLTDVVALRCLTFIHIHLLPRQRP